VDRTRRAFFVVDNDLVLEHAAHIGSNALALYVILACHARSTTGECYPSIRRLMRLMGRSRSVVMEATRVLQDHKLLTVAHRRSESGGQASNLYTLLPIASVTGAGAGADSAPAGMAEPVRRVVGGDDAGCQREVVRIGDALVHMADGGGNEMDPGVVLIADSPGSIGCLPPGNAVDTETDGVLNQTNENQTNITLTGPITDPANRARRAGRPPDATLAPDIPLRGSGEAARLPRRSDRMERPSMPEISALFESSGSTGSEAARFRNFYESKGWLVGRSPMRDWRAAARNWIGRDRAEGLVRRSPAPVGNGSRLAELSERNEARLEAMRARGALRPRTPEGREAEGQRGG